MVSGLMGIDSHAVDIGEESEARGEVKGMV